MAHSTGISRSRNQSFEGWERGMYQGRRRGLFAGVRRQMRRRVSVAHVLLFILAVFSFRIFLFFDLGGAQYGAKMNALAEGNALERVASVAMRLDPVSNWVIQGIRYGKW